MDGGFRKSYCYREWEDALFGLNLMKIQTHTKFEWTKWEDKGEEDENVEIRPQDIFWQQCWVLYNEEEKG